MGIIRSEITGSQYFLTQESEICSEISDYVFWGNEPIASSRGLVALRQATQCRSSWDTV